VKEAPAGTVSRSTALFFEGLEKRGIPGAHRLPRAEKGCEGSGRCCFVCPTGAKQSSDRAFLRPLGRAGGPELALGTELLDAEAPARAGGRARLLLREKDGGTRLVRADRLILSCGTLRTPYHARRLNPLARRAIGRGLSVHPAAKMFALFDERVEGWKGVPQGGGVVDPEDPKIRYEGVYTPPEMAAITLPLEGLRLRWWLDRYDRVATFGWMIRDESRGRVDYPLGAALPAIRYDLGDGDVARLRRAMVFAGRTFFAAGAKRIVLPFNRADNVFESPGQLEAFDPGGLTAASLQMMAFHPLGTCAMGRAVDENLRLTEGVYVCDGSVIPESLGVNPQMTIYAFALRLADHLDS
jgi:choline dehydrogenase-like flavoprotein